MREWPGSCGYDPQKHPDLVFLDIQMPEMNGFEVIEELGPEKMPVVIFCDCLRSICTEGVRGKSFGLFVKAL